MPAFPHPEWFLALGRRMIAERERFLRIGYLETRFVVRVDPDDGAGPPRCTGLVFDGYALVDARPLDDPWAFDPDFVVRGRSAVWRRMVEETERLGRPELRHTLNSLVLVGDELWLESTDQVREDKFYRFNQTLQEFFNLASWPRAASPSAAG